MAPSLQQITQIRVLRSERRSFIGTSAMVSPSSTTARRARAGELLLMVISRMNFFLLKSALFVGNSKSDEIPAAVAFFSVPFGIGAVSITIPAKATAVAVASSQLASAHAKADAAAGACRRCKDDYDERLLMNTLFVKRNNAACSPHVCLCLQRFCVKLVVNFRAMAALCGFLLSRKSC